MNRKIIVASCLAFAALLRLSAEGFFDYTDAAGITWKYMVNEDGTATIATPDVTVPTLSPVPASSLTVPSMIEGRWVTGIGPFAFVNCSSLRNLTIPSSVTGIDMGAFYGCASIKSMLIPDGVMYIGAQAFDECRNLTDVTLPASIKNIYGAAFARCRSLKTIVLPSGITYIDIQTFIECTSLQQITIPEEVTEIRSEAFSGCTSLQSVTFPSTLKFIGEHAFENCGSLLSVSLPDSVTGIDAYAFHGCKNLTSLTIPSGVSVISPYAFSECSGLISLTIPSTVVEIGQEAFSICASLTSVTIPASVVNLGLNAFSQCANLSIASVPRALKQQVIDNKVFENTKATVIYYDAVDDEITEGGGGGGTTSGTSSSSSSSSAESKPKVSGDAAGKLDSSFSKSQSVVEALYDAAGGLAGSVQVKTGKINSKGVVKVSATATLLDGKKVSSSSVKMEKGSDGTLGGYLTFKDPVGKMAFATAGDGAFSLTSDKYTAKKATVGGNLDMRSLAFSVAVSPEPNFGTGWKLLKEALPGEVQITVTDGKKWSFAKTPTLKYVKNGAGEYVLSGLDDEQKTNVSALKLSYTANTGVFKGRFKVYSTNADTVANGKAPKIKKHNVTVTGMMVNGAGEGLATCKNPKTESWKVTVK